MFEDGASTRATGPAASAAPLTVTLSFFPAKLYNVFMPVVCVRVRVCVKERESARACARAHTHTHKHTHRESETAKLDIGIMTMVGKDIQQSVHHAHAHRRICISVQSHVPKRRTALRAKK